MTTTPIFLRAFAVAAVIISALPARAATPAQGEPQELRAGLFLDVNLGALTAFGGWRLSDGAQMPSPPSPYLQIGVGYEAQPWLAVGLTFGLGASSDRCLGTMTAQGTCVESASDARSVASDFTIALLGAELSYRHALSPRLRLNPRLHLGWTFLDPMPRLDVDGGFHAGIALGLEWATPLDHFTLGLELDWRFIVGPNLNTVGIYPRVKYTF
ncbi:MAG: adventurous gliding motility protein CglE [Myxococcales bacterium]|jgi:hypothetical protein|nr:adventurous gliding motility protein CglE [Myxococcales bacterium]